MKRVVIANFYPVWPAIGGGQRRIFFLARELSKAFDVEIVVPERQAINTTLQFSPTLRETRVAVDPRFSALERRLDDEVRMAADVAYAMYWRECAFYQDVLAMRLLNADAVVTAHPYSIGPILQARGRSRIPVVFDSQNVEIRQKAPVLVGFEKYLELVRSTERDALEKSDLTLACSPGDAAAFEKEYGIDATTITIIENGVDARGVPSVPFEMRDQLRAKLGLSSRLAAVFGGSFHHPNFHAAERIVDLAGKLPEIVFVFLGGVCNYELLRDAKVNNIICLGEVDEAVKWMIFNIADIGLNPMEQGSGTNVKMFEYAAAGLAVLSTPFGARGAKLEPGSELLICDLDDMEGNLRALSFADRGRLHTIGDRARRRVMELSDWGSIGERYIESFKSLTD